MKATVIDKMFEANRNIRVIQHETPKGLLATEWKVPIEKLKLCKFGGIDEKGNEHEMDFDEIVISIERMGCYGFTDNKTDIHVWISEKTSPTDIINLLAHERGHLIKPNHRDLIKGEMKAEMYGICAEFAYGTFLNLTTNKGQREGKMEKVLVHDDENEDVHYIKGSFLSADKTLCGQRLHPISTIHIKKLDVTCKRCLNIFKR